LKPKYQSKTLNLTPRIASGGSVQNSADDWQLKIPSTAGGKYTLSQLDDYAMLPRSRMRWSPPTSLSLRTKNSTANLPGTWGFGFWNDPFNFSLSLGGMARRLPALPNAAWFFYSSPENFLSFQNNLPHNGLLAQTFSSPKIPSLMLAPGAFLLPLLGIKPLARIARSLIGKFVKEDSHLLELDLTQWHEYRLGWSVDQVSFSVDDKAVFETKVVPNGPLGVVIWIDNQYAAFLPSGEIKTGTLANNVPAWMEIENIEIN
jgi:hypothetical protein